VNGDAENPIRRPFKRTKRPTGTKMMPTLQQEKQQPPRDKRADQKMHAAIGARVMETLGRPGDLQRVQVRPLWEDNYRVNIFVGKDMASVKVAHSFFLVADNDGNIVASTPKIARRY
jgi:hypothetical protein